MKVHPTSSEAWTIERKSIRGHSAVRFFEDEIDSNRNVDADEGTLIAAVKQLSECGFTNYFGTS
jgi:hypothetical protein